MTCFDNTGDDWHSLATKHLVIKNLFGETYTVTTFMLSGLTKTSVILYHPVNHVSRAVWKNGTWDLISCY